MGCRWARDKGSDVSVETNNFGIDSRDVLLHRRGVTLDGRGEHGDSEGENTRKASDELHSGDEDETESVECGRLDE